MIIFDIETYKEISDANYINWKLAGISAPGNYKDPIKIAENIADQRNAALEKFPLSPLTGKIILIGMLLDKLPPFIEGAVKYSVDGKEVYYLSLHGDNEAGMLKSWWEIFDWNNLNSPDIVSFNGKKFDLPFILHRSLINKVQMPRKIRMSDYLNKYRDTPHFDVYNWFDGGSLVEWSYKLGYSDSLQRDGNKIGGWYEQGQMNLIIDKNKIDLAQTYAIYQRIAGWL